MNRLLLIAIFALFPFFGFCQSSHMSFMGFPMDCTITEFQKKLSGKGVSVSPANKKYKAGVRAFKGVFMSEKAIFLFFMI